MRPLLLAVIVALGPSVLTPSAEQSLAEVSRNTEAARIATRAMPPAKVYTNKDLAPAPQLPPTTASTNATAPAAPAPSKPSTDKKTPGSNDETYWRERMRPLRERLDDARAVAESTRQRAETLMRAADRCFAIGVVCVDYTESVRLTEQHKMLLADVEHAERDVAALEEEGRRAGVPPGWLRE
jgi:hypothetical protein